MKKLFVVVLVAMIGVAGVNAQTTKKTVAQPLKTVNTGVQQNKQGNAAVVGTDQKNGVNASVVPNTQVNAPVKGQLDNGLKVEKTPTKAQQGTSLQLNPNATPTKDKNLKVQKVGATKATKALVNPNQNNSAIHLEPAPQQGAEKIAVDQQKAANTGIKTAGNATVEQVGTGNPAQQQNTGVAAPKTVTPAKKTTTTKTATQKTANKPQLQLGTATKK